MTIWQLISRIIKKDTWLLISITSLLLIGGLVETISLLLVAPIVDIVTSKGVANSSSITQKVLEILGSLGMPSTIWFMLLVYVVIVIISAFFTTAVLYFVLRIKYSFLGDLIFKTTTEVFKAKWQFFSGFKQGILINTLTRELSIVGDTLAAFGRLSATSIQVIVFMAVPFYVSWKAMLIVSFVIFLVYAPLLLLGKYSSKLGMLNTKANNEYLIAIQESLAVAKVIIGLSTQDKAVKRINHRYQENIKAATKAAVFDNALVNTRQPLGAIGLTSIVITTQILDIPISEAAILAVAFVRVSGKINQIIHEKNLLDRSLPSMDQVDHIRANALEFKQKSGSVEFNNFMDKIEFQNVNFAYPNHEPVLHDINLTIPKGKMIAFVGESGAGKSSLVDVIMGFNDPISGSILVDGIPLDKYKIDTYRNKIGYVPQESVLFNMTIAENILWAKSDASIEEIRKACSDANADVFIESFQDKYNTLVGDRGTRLSGGQLQRVALARAIVRIPEILILDEATSALDTKAERQIQKAIERITKNTTAIVIAHRLSTIINADQIFVMNNGSIVEQGDYHSLKSRNGILSQMIREQEFFSQKDSTVSNEN